MWCMPMKTRVQIEPRIIAAAFSLALSMGFVVAQTPSLKVSRVSSTEFDKVIESVHKDYLRGSTSVPEEDQIEEFDLLYDDVVSVLRQHGSFSDGGLEEADFASSRYVDPGPILVIVNSMPVSQSLMEDLVPVLAKLRGDHAVVFDGVEMVAVFSDGRILKSN